MPHPPKPESSSRVSSFKDLIGSPGVSSSTDVESLSESMSILNPSEAEDKIKSWPSVRTPHAVVYLTKPLVNSMSCRHVRAILTGLHFTVEERYADFKFISSLHRHLNTAFPLPMFFKFTDPTVFIGGRYIAGVRNFRRLNQTGQLKKFIFGLPEKDGHCRYCGGFKFILASKKLITCTACNGTGLKSGLINSDILITICHSKLFICLEAIDYQQRHLYIICSVEGRWLTTQQSNPLTIDTEAVIYGYPSMGCGVYDSEIILAGGELPYDDPDPHVDNGCIVYDMTSNCVSHVPFLLMNTGKHKPLVFQLSKRLYVCDSKYHLDDTKSYNSLSMEYLSPSLKVQWRNVISLFKEPGGSNDSLANYSCLVFGNSCLLSLPEDATYITHCNHLDCDWKKYSNESLPFNGVATFYAHKDFEDFVMIYLNDGVVKVCQFDFSSFGNSQELFTVESRTGGADMHGHFADFGKGCFCLTAFDNLYVYVYTFVISRQGTQSDPLNITHRIISRYSFGIDRFSTQERRISRIVGCFAPAPNEEAKSRAEELAATYFKKYPKVDDDYDLWEPVICKDWTRSSASQIPYFP